MKKEKLIALFKNPELVTEQDLTELQQIIKDYPYFHAAHFLFLFATHQTNAGGFEQAIGKSALYLTSRAHLYEAIQLGWGKSFASQKVNTKSPDLQSSIAPSIEEEPITEVLKAESPEIEKTESNLREVESISIPLLEEKQKDDVLPFVLEESAPVEISDKLKEEIITKSDNSCELLELEIMDEEDNNKNKDVFSDNLIESFLKNTPRMVPRLDLNDTRGDISTESISETEGPYTETLAVIYEQQGLYQKSIEIYNKLILKYPEKSAYFATRIKELENFIK